MAKTSDGSIPKFDPKDYQGGPLLPKVEAEPTEDISASIEDVFGAPAPEAPEPTKAISTVVGIEPSTEVERVTKAMTQLVDVESAKREILNKYLKDNLTEGVDYGVVMKGGKPSLFKPGSEKFASLLHLRVKFAKDTDTWEMAGSTPGLFCYVCQLINKDGEVVGEGRGAASIQEKKNANTAIKIAQKRSQVDAVLRVGGLSEVFSQDLEDLPKDERPKPQAVASDELPTVPLDPENGKPCPKCKQGFVSLKSGVSKKTGKNYAFYGCSRWQTKDGGCDFKEWADSND